MNKHDEHCASQVGYTLARVGDHRESMLPELGQRRPSPITVQPVEDVETAGQDLDRHRSPNPPHDDWRVDLTEAREKLRDASAQGAERQRKIQMPAVTAGCISITIAITCTLLLPVHAYISIVGVMLLYPSAFMLLLALLPTESRKVNLVAKACLVLACGLTIVYIVDVYIYFTTYCDSSTWPTAACKILAEGWGVLTIFQAALTAYVAVRLGWATLFSTSKTSSTRALLDLCWRVGGESCLAFATINMAWLGVYVGALGKESDEAYIGVVLALPIVQVVTGVFVVRPGVRMCVQAWLTARGHAVSTAASIAALIGRRSPEVVIQEAESRFRAISLADLDEADIASSTPDQSVFNKSKPARLGEVDAFLSHSCARRAISTEAGRPFPPLTLPARPPRWQDDPKIKWAQIQAWRMDFRTRHGGREPLVWVRPRGGSAEGRRLWAMLTIRISPPPVDAD